MPERTSSAYHVRISFCRGLVEIFVKAVRKLRIETSEARLCVCAIVLSTMPVWVWKRVSLHGECAIQKRHIGREENKGKRCSSSETSPFGARGSVCDWPTINPQPARCAFPGQNGKSPVTFIRCMGPFLIVIARSVPALGTGSLTTQGRVLSRTA